MSSRWVEWDWPVEPGRHPRLPPEPRPEPEPVMIRVAVKPRPMRRHRSTIRLRALIVIVLAIVAWRILKLPGLILVALWLGLLPN